MEIDKKKIGVIGYWIGKTVLHSPHIEATHPNVIIVIPPDNSFMVNDKRYTKRPEKPIKGGFANMMIRQYTKQYFRDEFTYSDDSFIIEQYRLIQGKKCRLSKSRRDKIENEFNRRFQSI